MPKHVLIPVQRLDKYAALFLAAHLYPCPLLRLRPPLRLIADTVLRKHSTVQGLRRCLYIYTRASLSLSLSPHLSNMR